MNNKIPNDNELLRAKINFKLGSCNLKTFNPDLVIKGMNLLEAALPIFKQHHEPTTDLKLLLAEGFRLQRNYKQSNDYLD